MNTAFSHLVAIGASAGGLNALAAFLGALPDDFATPVVITLHSSETRALPNLLSERTSMEVKVATDKTPVACGCVYICPGGADTYFENWIALHPTCRHAFTNHRSTGCSKALRWNTGNARSRLS